MLNPYINHGVKAADMVIYEKPFLVYGEDMDSGIFQIERSSVSQMTPASINLFRDGGRKFWGKLYPWAVQNPVNFISQW